MFTRRQVAGIVTIVFVALFSVWGWYEASVTMIAFDRMHFLLALLSFSLAFACMILGMAIWQERVLGFIAGAGMFLPSLFFVVSLWHAGFVFLGIALVFVSTRLSQRILSDRLHFSFWESASAGKFLFLLAFTCVLTSAYAVESKQVSWEALMPQLRLGDGVVQGAFRVLGVFRPEFKEFGKREMSVDDFLLDIRSRSGADESRAVPDLSDEALRRQLDALGNQAIKVSIDESFFSDARAKAEEAFLASGRAQMSELVGRSVSGEERLADVFSEGIQKKMLTFFEAGSIHGTSSHVILRIILSVLLFLSVFPLLLLLYPLWVFLGFLFFSLLRITHICVLEIRTVDQYFLKD